MTVPNKGVDDLMLQLRRKIEGMEYLGLKPIEDNPEGRKVYLVVSDLHIPFELDGVSEYISKFKGFVDGLIIAGDFLDEHGVSSFVKDKHVSLRTEMVKGHKYLKEWSEIFPEIHMIKGNHDERIDTHLRKSVYSETLFLLPTNLCLSKYEEGFIIPTDDGEEKVYEPIKNLKTYDNWYMQIGDAFIAHPKSFSRVNGKTAMKTYEYFKAYGEDIKCLMIGHTHQACRITPNNYTVCMEIGCNCKEQGYAKSGKVNYRPQVNALAVLVLDDNKVNTGMTTYHLIKDL